MIENTYGEKGDSCWGAPCTKSATHKLVTLVPAENTLPEIEQSTWYCFEHALHFCAWLPYVYGHKVLSLTPSWKDYRDSWMKS